MQLFARARLCKGMVLQDCQTLNDEQVVERVRAGEIGLYELLMRRYNQRVYRVVRSVLMNSEDAEDVLQEAWVRAYEHLKPVQRAGQLFNLGDEDRTSTKRWRGRKRRSDGCRSRTPKE